MYTKHKAYNVSVNLRRLGKTFEPSSRNIEVTNFRIREIKQISASRARLSYRCWGNMHADKTEMLLFIQYSLRIEAAKFLQYNETS